MSDCCKRERGWLSRPMVNEIRVEQVDMLRREVCFFCDRQSVHFDEEDNEFIQQVLLALDHMELLVAANRTSLGLDI